MTSFCSQCGNQVRAGGKFCQSCGAVAAQSTPPRSQADPIGSYSGQNPGGAGYAGGSAGYQSSLPGSFPAQQGVPPGQSPYGSPAPRSGKTLKVILITLLVLLVLIGGAVATATFMLRRAVGNMVQVSEGTDGKPSVVLDIPGVPKISAGTGVTEEELGVPIYPGAEAQKDGTSSVSISGGSAETRGWIGVAVFVTEDGMDEVVAFYREKLSKGVRTVETTNDGKRSAVFQVQAPQGWRMVTVEEDGAEATTKIVIASVTGKSAQ